MGAVEQDRTAGEAPDARERIRDAALRRFAADGVAGTSVRAVAAEAGVSPALVIHHYGSKDALRAVCDAHVAATIRERKHAAMAAGLQLDLLAAFEQAGDVQPLLRYLARTLVDGSPQVVALVEEMVEDAVAYTERGVASGLLEPTDDPRARAVVLTIWSLGALVLHEHLERLLGADLTSGLAGTVAYAAPATEILAHGALSAAFADRADAAVARMKEQR